MRKPTLLARPQALGLLIVALIAAGLGLVVRAGGELGWLERGSVDARFSLRGRLSPPAGVALVGIDDETLGSLPRYPFSRVLDARVLERLHAAGARLVVYDIAFDRPTTEAADLALFDAAKRAAPVVFATSLISTSGATEVLGGNANLASIGAQAAAADLLPDSDGVIRHMLGQVNGLPTIAAAVTRTLTGHAASADRLRGAWIDFRGPPGTVPSMSFLQVLRDRFDAREVRGKVVVIGATAPVLQDLHDTAVGGPMSGPEVQAEAISTALSGFPLHSAAPVATVLLIVLLALLVPAAALRVGALGSALVGLGGACLWSLATQLAFDRGVVLDYSAPLLALLLGACGALLLRLRSDSRERRRLRMLFAADTPAVVDRILHAPGSGPLSSTAIIAGYRIEEAVGRGGMGVVYRATQIELERTVAIKLIASERSADAEFRQRFKRESRAAASIDHANVIPVYEAGEDDGLLFIAMRLVDGVDLAQLLGRVAVLQPARAIPIVEQLASALDAAHARGLVHRDVKPANVLLTIEEPEHVYLTDFGIATSIGASSGITRTTEWVGTLDYLAPEQIRGESVGVGVDIYALAGLLYRCLTGESPYPRDNDAATLWAHVNDPPPAPSQIGGSLPAALDEVIARGMAKRASDRYPSASELARAAALALGVASRLCAVDTRQSGGPAPRKRIAADALTVVPDTHGSGDRLSGAT
jgi:serine/threonine protein kinase/CHASE2 domain-containing sensor protein